MGSVLHARRGTLRGGALAAGAVLGWCLLAAASALVTSARRAPDPMAALQAEFQLLLRELPASGEVGFLDSYQGSNEDTVRMHYAAQYALAPRIVVGRVGPDFLIVARGTANPDGDPRLAGYHQLETFPGGHRLFARLER